MEILKGLVAIEGIDGSGKSTFLKTLKEKFNSKDVNILRYDSSPFDEKAIEYTRSLLTNENKMPKPVKNRALLFAFLSDFLIHENNIENYFFDEHYLGKPVIVSDRYILSTIAYQSLYIDFDEVINIIETSGVKLPQVVLYLRCDPKIACKRILERAKKDGKALEMFEEEELLEKISKNYEKALEWYKQKFDTGCYLIECDSALPIEEYEKYVNFLVETLETEYMGYSTSAKETEEAEQSKKEELEDRVNE